MMVFNLEVWIELCLVSEAVVVIAFTLEIWWSCGCDGV